MIVYNITVNVDWAIAAPWLQWFTEEQAPEIVATGCFSKYHVLQLLQVDEADGPTYALQFYANRIEDYENYITHFAPHFQQKASYRWGDGFMAFQTLMSVVV